MRLNEVARKLKRGGADHNDARGRRRAGVAPLGDELLEAAYEGNIGAMEMFKFYQVASEKQKQLMAQYLKQKLFDKAWALLKQVTGVKLR